MVPASWDGERRSGAVRARRPRRRPGVPLALRLLLAVVLAAGLALGTSYMLRTLNL